MRDEQNSLRAVVMTGLFAAMIYIGHLGPADPAAGSRWPAFHPLRQHLDGRGHSLPGLP